jgi:hypothetical protein
VFIFELCDLLKRVNSARESGYAVQDDYRATILAWSSAFLDDITRNEAEKRQLEGGAKANEIAKIARKVKLMKLDGFSSWLSWSYQAKELMAGIMNG